MPQQLAYTKDGSATLVNTELNATYHSVFGAIQESRHIFIQQGLYYAIKTFGKTLNIFESGFGTGLNAALTLQEAEKNDLQISYTSVEKYPVDLKLAAQLNYPEQLDLAGEQFLTLHSCPWQEAFRVTSSFTLIKKEGDINSFIFPEKLHLIYYDAFAPEDAPEMWHSAIFEKLYAAMLPGACLVTFCAKGHIKRLLKQTGFTVQALPGPPGKREMTKATR